MSGNNDIDGSMTGQSSAEPVTTNASAGSCNEKLPKSVEDNPPHNADSVSISTKSYPRFATLSPPVGQFIIGTILNTTGIACAIAFGVFAVRSVNLARMANDAALEANDQAELANRIAFISLCIANDDISDIKPCQDILQNAAIILPGAASKLGLTAAAAMSSTTNPQTISHAASTVTSALSSSAVQSSSFTTSTATTAILVTSSASLVSSSSMEASTTITKVTPSSTNVPSYPLLGIRRSLVGIIIIGSILGVTFIAGLLFWRYCFIYTRFGTKKVQFSSVEAFSRPSSYSLRSRYSPVPTISRAAARFPHRRGNDLSRTSEELERKSEKNETGEYKARRFRQFFMDSTISTFRG